MITEDYVSFEVAKLLKEKRFISCATFHYYYDKDGNLLFSAWGADAGKNEFVAPTLQMTMKWLRKVHRLFIFISPWAMRENNNIQYYFEIREIKTHDFETLYDYTTKELDSFEKAADTAILYCLQNLI